MFPIVETQSGNENDVSCRNFCRLICCIRNSEIDIELQRDKVAEDGKVYIEHRVIERVTPQAGREGNNKQKKKDKLSQRIIQDNEAKANALRAAAAEIAKENARREALLPKKPQSGVEGVSIVKASTDLDAQNVAFSDYVDTEMYTVSSEMDPTRMLQDSNDAELSNFFSRPIKIREYEWSTSTTLAEDFNPWTDYFTNNRVSNRLTNFNLLRAKLHVKVVINGNGFQYGRAILAYNPLDTFDDLSTFAALVDADLVQTSQLPHVYLDPTLSKGGDMLLPFFFHKNYMSIPDGDWDSMGRCYLRSLNALKHANGATDVVTISVFAWAEDVAMSVLTNVDANGITPQSGQEIDEANTKGTISGPASVVAKGARALSGISVIAPYAMATAKAADVIGGVAKLFGYCAPPVTKAPEPYRPTTTSTLAMTNVPQTVQRLTVDDKQELTIDPRIAGLSGDDPMNIRDIAKRESYITKFGWSIGSAPETLLWNTRVTPVTWAETGLTPPSIQIPPCCMAALPFKYWTGTMRFRFQIVCSSFHKGRLKFVYDPNHIDTTEYNTNYMKIVDISKTQDFVMEIGNGQSTTLLNSVTPGLNSVTEVYSTTAYTGNAPGNGTLSVYILNELTTPNSTVNNDIEINVFVSAGDDFEVFIPDSSRMANYTFFAPQSGNEEVPDAQKTENPSAPFIDNGMKLGPSEQDLSDVNKVFVGESIASFRPLLKRFNLHETFHLFQNTRHSTHIRCMYPYLRGFAPDPVHSGNYNYVNTVLIHWITKAFAGHRGSIRWKLIPRQIVQGAESLNVYMQRNYIGVGAEYLNVTLASPSYSTYSQSAITCVNSTTAPADPSFPLSSHDGGAYTHSNVNPTMEVEIPYYSAFRFSPGKESNYTGIELFDPTYRINITSRMLDGNLMDLHCATGEDFQVYFWTGLPRLYYESSPPAIPP